MIGGGVQKIDIEGGGGGHHWNICFLKMYLPPPPGYY